MKTGKPKKHSAEDKAVRHRAANDRYYQSDKAKGLRAEASRRYAQNHPEMVRAFNMTDHAKRIGRCPTWLTKEHLKEIRQFYKDADYIQNLTKTKMEVDHIVPLRGVNVSGLHVPWNLQILSATENREKKNKFGG